MGENVALNLILDDPEMITSFLLFLLEKTQEAGRLFQLIKSKNHMLEEMLEETFKTLGTI